MQPALYVIYGCLRVASWVKSRRDNIYERSSNYFFKTLADETLKDNNFSIFKESSPIDYKNFFSIKDTLSKKLISIKVLKLIGQRNVVTRNLIDLQQDRPDRHFPNQKISGSISVLHRKRNQSDIYFLTDSFWIDCYGNIDKIDQIWFTGQFGENRAGDMLPIDYAK